MNLLRAHGSPTLYRYGKGCRCVCCKGSQNERMRLYLRRYTAEHGISYARAKYPEQRRVLRSAERRQWRQEHHDEWLARLDALNSNNRRTRRRARALRRLGRAARGTSGACVWYVCRCEECGAWVTVKGHKPKFCSDACKARAKAARHRVRRRGWKVTAVRRFAIYERDAWTCQICGDPVNRDADPLADDAPCLDHIIPVARGGPHCEGNLQCAHRYCNSVKRDTDLCLLMT